MLTLVLIVCFLGLATGASDQDETTALVYLYKYQYLAPSRSNEADVQEAIRSFQSFFGLPVTGKLDKEALNEMAKPRCGVPDLHDNNRHKRFVLQGTWGSKRLLTYYLQPGYDLYEYEQTRIMRDAFDVWSKHADLIFKEIDDPEKADLKLSFGSGEHGGTNSEPGTCLFPFDGTKGTLAHAFYPRDGRIHFDEDEYFSDGPYSGYTDLRFTATHEIGHALGLKHSRVKGAVMWPSYFETEKVELGDDDIEGIQSLYGPPKKPSYYLAENGGESCDAVCETKGKICAATNHGLENAEKIFAQLYVSCITLPDTDEYKYDDNPGYYTGGAWKKRCIGFKNVPDTIDCQAGSNPDMRRLCPCRG